MAGKEQYDDGLAMNCTTGQRVCQYCSRVETNAIVTQCGSCGRKISDVRQETK